MLAFLTSAICLLSCTQANIPSPAASVDLICHTSNSAECYPREFVPSDEFQIVHDDQSIPKGLHVRLNLATGVKEAKINVPDLDESEQRYSDLTVEIPFSEHEQRSDLITVEEPEEPTSPPATNDQSTPESQHPLRPPPVHPQEHSVFTDSVAVLKSSSVDDNSETQLLALSNLEDLAHSYHWGVTLSRDRGLSHKIFQLLSASSPSSEIRSAAALLLGTAIHNNPDALSAALTHFYNDEWPTGPLEAVMVALFHETLPRTIQRLIFLLSGLCHDRAQLSKFVDAEGLDLLLSFFNSGNVNPDYNEKLQVKIANFVLDHFLQMDEVAISSSEKKTLRKTDRVKNVTVVEEIVPKKEKSILEALSKLDGEEPWILTDKEKKQDSVLDDTIGTRGNMASILLPWCSAFQHSIRRAKLGRIPSAASSLTNIEEAQSALKHKLETNGYNCR